ncbi:hypothetical protein GCM10010532_019070 [Dactylosporangium siamense]|uniref:Uncharacterized protein n=1 Tax=Dactylosporangium siamense TaxID=685454 RepID=A0A919UJ88_9ACTN|nr:hypothetical protein Dsi01nite_104790 [Dactylosporangium siamense]
MRGAAGVPCPTGGSNPLRSDNILIRRSPIAILLGLAGVEFWVLNGSRLTGIARWYPRLWTLFGEAWTE